MFFKSKTPQERHKKAQRKIDKFLKKRDKLDKYSKYTPEYEERRKKLTRKIAREIENKEVAKAEILNPPKVPQYYNTSKKTIIQTEINAGKNKNSATANFNTQFNKKVNKGNSKQSNKKSKVKFCFYLIVTILVLSGVIALTVHITNCENDRKNSSSIIPQITEI